MVWMADPRQRSVAVYASITATLLRLRIFYTIMVQPQQARHNFPTGFVTQIKQHDFQNLLHPFFARFCKQRAAADVAIGLDFNDLRVFFGELALV